MSTISVTEDVVHLTGLDAAGRAILRVNVQQSDVTHLNLPEIKNYLLGPYWDWFEIGMNICLQPETIKAERSSFHRRVEQIDRFTITPIGKNPPTGTVPRLTDL